VNGMTNEARAELERLKALEALDTLVNARKRQDATPGASPEAQLAVQARAALVLARWAVPMGSALSLAGLWIVLTHATPVAALGLFAGVAAQAAIATFMLGRKLS